MGDNTSVVNKFSIDSMPAGIIQLTLFDHDWNRLQERIVFINSMNKHITIDKAEKNWLPKTKNTIEFVMPDTLATNLSASIADINFYDMDSSHSIKQNLWINDQLKGFNSNINEEIETGNMESIDLVMLTHGWRKYNWKNTGSQSQETNPVDNYLSLNIN